MGAASARLEADGGAIDVELGGVEDEEAGGRGHGDGDGRGAREGAYGEVRAEAEVVAERGREVREARLAPELVRRGRHCRWWRGRATSRRRRSGRRAAVEEVDWWDERSEETATARQAGARGPL